MPYILQGSVATRLRCGGIFSDDYVVYIVLSNVQYLKDYENRTAFEEAIYGKISGRPTLLSDGGSFCATLFIAIQCPLETSLERCLNKLKAS